MTLQRKTLIVAGLTFTLLLVVLVATSYTVLGRKFAALERREMGRAVDTVHSVVRESAAGLAAVAKEWAQRSETRDLMLRRAPVEHWHRADVRALVTTGATATAYFAPDGSLLYGYEPDGGRYLMIEKETSTRLVAALRLGEPEAESGWQGLVALPRGPAVVAYSQVKASDDDGRVLGFVVLARYLGTGALRHLGKSLLAEVTIHAADAPDHPEDVRAVVATLGKEGPTKLFHQGERHLAAYLLAENPGKQPGVILRVVTPREVGVRTAASVRHIGLFLLLAGLASVALVLTYLNRTVLSRITALSRDVRRVGSRPDSGERVHVDGTDELSGLALDINRALESLDRSRADLRRSEARYRGIVEDQTEFICRWTPDRRLTFANETYRRRFGAGAQDLLGHRFLPLIPEDDRKQVDEALAALGPDRPLLTMEHRVLTSDGRLRWVSWTHRAIADAAGGVVEMQSVGGDITSRKQAEQRLASINRCFLSFTAVPQENIDSLTALSGELLSADHVAYYRLEDEEPVPVSRWNAPACDGCECRGDGDLCRTVMQLGATDTLAVCELPQRGEPGSDPELSVREPKMALGACVRFAGEAVGALCALFCSDYAPTDEDKDLLSVIASAISGAEQRRVAAQRLQTSNETAWALLNSTSDPVVLLTPTGSILGINAACADGLGKSIATLVGTDLFSHLTGGTLEVVEEHFRKAVETGRPQVFLHDTADNHQRVSVYPILDADGNLSRVSVFAHDITDERRAQDAQRLAAMGQLATGVAHEFNNLLASMMMRAELAQRRRTQEEYERLVELVLRATTRGSEVCGSLAAFARPREPKRETIDIAEPLRAALAVTETEMRRTGIDLQETFMADGHRVHADAGQMEQVFLNLLINARHAMPTGGTLAITTEYDPLGDQVVATIADTGEGIPPEHLPRVFEPFFTTKGRLGDSSIPGTGLGLSVSHGIITAHGGTIEMSSHVGEGTTVQVCLPARGAEA